MNTTEYQEETAPRSVTWDLSSNIFGKVRGRLSSVSVQRINHKCLTDSFRSFLNSYFSEIFQHKLRKIQFILLCISSNISGSLKTLDFQLEKHC